MTTDADPSPQRAPEPQAGAVPPTWQPPSEQPPVWQQPAAPRPSFRERTIKLWHAIVVGLACLIVGAGVSGVIVGHHGHDDRRGPGDFRQFPGGGPGGAPGQNFGPGQGNGQGTAPGTAQGGTGQGGTGQGSTDQGSTDEGDPGQTS